MTTVISIFFVVFIIFIAAITVIAIFLAIMTFKFKKMVEKKIINSGKDAIWQTTEKIIKKRGKKGENYDDFSSDYE